MKKLFIALAALLTFTTSAFAEIGSDSIDLVFTPVTPCRIMDTRNPGSISGILVAGTIRTFNGNSSSGNYISQGSSKATCGLPFITDVAAVVLNFTTVSPATGGYITAYPADVADVNKPEAATVNFTPGSVVGNNATLKIDQGSASAQFKIFTTSNVHVVADVVGYYSKPVKTALECTIVNGTLTNVPAGSAGTNALPPSCPSNSFYTASYCYTFGFGTTVAGWNRNACNFTNASAGAINVRHDISCCSIPGR